MKSLYLIPLGLVVLVFSACVGGTTDPRKGGLFSYNPDAYEKRLKQREQELSTIERDTQSQKQTSTILEKDLASEKNKMK